MEQDFYLYYSTQRPVSIGTYPNSPDNPPTEIKNFDTRLLVENGTFRAWGTITYTKPLSELDVKGYELRPSRENPDVRRTVAEQLEVVGPWEERAKMSVSNRVTYRDEDTGTFKLTARATPMHLTQQYSRAQKFPNWKEPFYHSFHPSDKLNPGASIELTRKVEFDEWRADLSDVAELVKLSPAELGAEREDSVQKEQEILKKLQDVLSEWEGQAAQTLQLDKALEYVHTPVVSHTSNEWQQQKGGKWCISNLTYYMEFEIWEDGAKPGTFRASWGIGMNRPKRPPSEKYFYAGEPFFDGQNKKPYDSMEAAQKYIQGRFDLYAHFFTELRPPVPDRFKRNFTINGVLLPGYTIEPPEDTAPDQSAVEALLDFLEDEGKTAPPTEPAAEKTPAPQKPSAPPGGKTKRPSPKTKPKRKNTMSR